MRKLPLFQWVGLPFCAKVTFFFRLLSARYLNSGSCLQTPAVPVAVALLLASTTVAWMPGAFGQTPSGNVVISSNTTWASGSYQINSLTVNGGATLTIGGGSTVAVAAGVTVTANSAIVLQSANNASQVNGTWQGTGVTFNAASVEVDAGSSINADGQGYVANAGPGGSPAGSSAGGSYGGLGGASNGVNASGTYGSTTAPIDLGSGGGVRCCGAVAGLGGGAVTLNVSGTLTNNGVISANGGTITGYQAGAGSGGSVYVTTSVLTGTGAFEANGGLGGEAGGGGGRIAVYYNGTSSSFTGFSASTVSAGGCGNQCSSPTASAGGNGTAAFFDTSATNNNVAIYQNFVIPASTAASYNNLTVQAGALLTVGGGSTVTVANMLTVNGTVVAQSMNNAAQVNGTWQGVGVGITAASVVVSRTGSINADAQGYLANAGPGGSPGGTSAGGSYGGLGGVGNGSSPSPPYGSPTAPVDLGSGGSSRCCGTIPGPGGGALTFTVSGTLTNNGIISANGFSGQGVQVGGSSGGTVSIHAGTLAGSGTIAVNGGSGGEAGGGGGRTAIYYNANSGFNLDSVTANGGSSSSGNAGASGTVYTLAMGSSLTVSDNTTLPSNANLTYSSVTINNSATLTLGSGTTLTANSINVSNTSNFIVGGGSTLNISGAMVVTGNSNIILQSINNAAQVNGVWAGQGVTLNAGSLEVDLGSSINANGQGYVPGAGPGGAAAATSAGGSYGGVGGTGAGVAGAAIYGSATAPTDLGSGGNVRCCSSVPGAGGGAMLLNIAGTLSNNGVISANGQNIAGLQSGAGSGGSVYVTTGALLGAGLFEANGGLGGEAGGGGGRIAVYYNGSSSNFTGFAGSTASAGGCGGQCSNGTSSAGSVGTSGFFDTSATNNNLSVYQNFVIPASTTVSYNSITAQPGALITIGGGSNVTVANALTVSGTVIAQAINNTAQVNTAWAGSGVTVSAASVVVNSGGSLNADGQGYGPNAGPGGAAGGSDAGGSYGGVGGASNGVPAAATYGSSTAPTDLGSGGGSRCCGTTGGAGGGALLLTVSGTLTDNGIISANGAPAVGLQASGGSGGSVAITTGTLSGSGSIAANGGGGSGEAAGGGGRVAVYFSTNSNFNLALVTANGATTVNGNPGLNGTVYTLGASTNLIVSDDTILPANSTLNYTTITINNQGSLTFGSGSTVTANSITVSGGGTFTIGGGSNVTVSGAVVVTGNSNMVLQSINNATQVNGIWQGAGVNLSAASIEVDAGSSINADGQGYGISAGPGGAPNGSSAGGSYGGLGGNSNGVAPSPTYGSPTAPIDLGSGGGSRCCGSTGGAGGGAMRLVVSGTLTNNGIISANGALPIGNAAGGGSGGSVYIITGTVTGSGSFLANGGSGGEASGGGGRIALYYLTNIGFNPSSIVAGTGTSGNLGAAGTVTFSNTPQFLWVAPTSTVLYGTETLEWMAGAVNLVNTTVNIVASGPQILTVGAGLNPNSSFVWNTATVPDGRYVLNLIFYDANGNDIQELPRTVVINNSIAWHSGTITSNQEWTASQVQGLNGTVIIPSGVTVTVDPGTIIKALPGSQIIVQSGGILNALGNSALPIIFTAFDDSSVGGDSDFSGGLSVATPGEWNGISVQAGGQFNSNSYTEILYVQATQSGTLPASEAWPGDQMFVVNGIVTVPNGATLTIQPGAVVKFGPNGGITVQPGGQLTALGTIAQPIYFTSINDNTIGTPAAGSTGTPMPGDWGSIIINGGKASFNDVQMLYGGGPQNSSNLLGMIETGNNAVVNISNSILGRSFWDALLTGYVNNAGIGGDTVTLTNSLVYGVEDRALEAWPGSTLTVTNDTLDGNNTGIQGHGGAITVFNTIVTNSSNTTWGGIDTCGGGTVTVSYTDVWNSLAGIPNYACMTDPTGSSGNLEANPVYVNNAAGNYRLNYGSPAIDAASGKAPNYSLTDALGDPRYNDPLVTNKTGVADGNGNYPDMGAFEFVQTAVSNIDLTVPSVTGPASALSGSQVQLNWTDTNTGTGTAQGPWHDAIYLVQDPDTNPVLLLAGEVLVANGVTLGPGESYAATGTVRVPGATVGNQRWEVVTNDRGEVFVGQNAANDSGISLDTVAINLPQLVVGSAASNNSFSAAGQSWWYKINPGAGQTISVNLSLSGSVGTTNPGSVQLFVGQGYVPTPQHFDIQQVEWNSPSASLVISGTSDQTYYVTAYALALASTPAPFSISATAVQFSLTSVQPATISNYGTQEVTFVGGGFSSSGSYQLVGSNNAVYTASSVFVADSTHAQVTFAMSGGLAGAGVPNGTYTARVIENGSTVSLPNAVTVTTIPANQTGGAYGTYQVNVQAPQEFRTGFPAEVTLNYQNVSGYDQPAPLIWITATNATLSQIAPQCSGCNSNFPYMYQSVSTSGLVLGIANQGPAGILPGGAQGSVTLLANPTGGDVTFTAQVIDPLVADLLISYQIAEQYPCTAGASCNPQVTSFGLFANATALCNAYLPPGYNGPGFTRTCMQFLNSSGFQYVTCIPSSTSTVLQYCVNLDGSSVNTLLAADATALSKQGIYESDANRMIGFELQNDGLDVFNQRYHQGAFGFGRSHPFDITAGTSSGSGVVINYPDGRIRFFTTVNPVQSNQYLGIPGDYGVLTVNADTTWTLTESNGIIYHFKPISVANTSISHGLDYIQDLNGNRITTTYTNGRVTSAVDTVGNTISYIYDADGHITQATDPVGRVTTYTYDIKTDAYDSTFLTSMTDATGTTSFAWNEGGPSGVGYFADSCVQTYCEPAIGVNTITYPNGSHTYFTYDALGRLASQYRDGPTQTVTYSYGAAGAMTATDADGNMTQFIPNEYGEIAQTIDPLGSVTQLAYDPEQKLTGIQGPLGTSSSIGYDTQGNVALLLDPLGNQQNLSSAANNLLQSFSDASGNATNFSYDNHYNLIGVAAPDGTKLQATYDGFGNQTSWTNRRGHTIKYTYNSLNQLTAKTYANGFEQTYTYDSDRNLASVTATNGTTTFTHDAADRLTGIAYPNGQFIHYVYNAGGQRTSMTDSTGFTVLYTYDSANRLIQLTNGSNALIVSYSYDAAGLLAKKTRGNGTYTTYTYDAAQNPLHVINNSASGGVLSEFDYTYDALSRQATVNAPSGSYVYNYDADSQITQINLPSSIVAYTYDADGNRVTGAGLNYNINSLDQDTAAGTNAYQYDTDGNLISGGGWTYTYDDENRLVGAVSATDTWTYQYDGLGARISATHNGVTTQYLNDPSGYGNVEAEFTGAGQLISHYTFGLDLTSAVSATGSAAYYHFDAAGNTAQMTNASGAVVDSYTYLPFGEKVSSSGSVANPFTYVGEYGVMDEGSGLYFMRNRWYSPALGRFVQQDPIGLAGGTNFYAYAANGPANTADPLGTDPPIGAPGNTNASIDAQNEARQAAYDDGMYSQSPAQRTEQMNTTIQGAKAQTLETAVTLTAPELEVTENLPANYAFNKYGPHKVLENVLGKVLGAEEPPEPAEPTEPGPNPEPGPAPAPPAPQKSYIVPCLLDMANFFTGGYLFNKQPQNTTTVPAAHSVDPNGKLTSGFGNQGFVPPATPIVYTIYFENQATATAPAEEVVVTDPLPSNLDWSTVQLSQIEFNNVTIDVPAGLQAYVSKVNVSTDPNPVSVNAALNPNTGVLSWTMQSVDPSTGGLPANPLAGFLPPNSSSNLGTGYVTFTVMPKSGLANGSTIANQGSIVFDANAAISTNAVTNTIDSVYPVSNVNALPATSTTASFPVSWSGTDPGGAGIASYDIYVSVSGAAYTLWLPATTSTTATYSGAANLTYAFYSMATDNVGLRQQAVGAVQTTTVNVSSGSKITPTVTVSPATSSITTAQSLSVPVTVGGGSGNPTPTGTITLTSGSYTSSATTLASGSATILIPSGALNPGSDTLTVTYSGDTNYSTNTGTASVMVTAIAAATPTFSPAAGSYTSAQTVTISDVTTGATIYYTTNGTPPSTSSTVYSGPITVSSTETIEAIATATGYSTSGVATAVYTIAIPQAATPTFSPVAGSYTAAQTVTISDATPGATIYYTINGTPPSTSSTVYSGPIAVASTETIAAIATAAGYSPSAAATAVYTINIPPVITATVAPASLTFAAQAAGSSSAAQTVTLTDTGTGALAISSITASANFAETNTCGSSVAAGGNCTISVTFAPTAAGNVTGTLTITDNAGGSPQTVSLTGTATAAPNPIAMTASSTALSISAPGGSATDTIQISSAQSYSGTVALSCVVTFQGSGQASYPPTCALKPASGPVAPGAPLAATLTVSTTGNAASVRSNWPWLPSGAALAALCFVGLLPRRRRLTTYLFGLLALGGAFSAVGCGSPQVVPQTTTGVYQVAVTASNSAVSASTTITLTLQ